jgi:hypothetical protein
MRKTLRLRGATSSANVFAAIALSSIVLSTGCLGAIGDGSGEIAAGSGDPNDPGRGGTPGGPGPSTGAPGPGYGQDALVASTRVPRLTHAQWENSVRDLLKLPSPPGMSANFTTDPPGSTFGNDGELLKVTPGLWGDYQKAAEALADRVTKDAAALAKITPSGLPADADGKAKGFVEDFGMRAFRRPLEAEEVTRFVALFKRGVELTGMTDAFAAGANVVITAMLQAPPFVYRLELGSDLGDGTLSLGPWERASRLSFALWNTMPDDALFGAAKDGSIVTPEGFEAQARRMIDDPRARPTIETFHEKLLHFDHFDNLTKDTTKFPEWQNSMSTTFKEEARLFVREVTIGASKGLSELLTASYTFVNDRTAPLYGLSGITGTELRKVDLDPTQRAGFLTQVGFLASHASPRDTDPIHRGVFVNLSVICAGLPPPPMNVPPLPPDKDNTLTMRERITKHTDNEACRGCHNTMINPAGFAFEAYDALGKWRTVDNGKPVDTAASFPFEDGVASWKTPVEFAKLLASKPQVHKCYAGNWLEFAYGRQKANGDQALIAKVAETSLSGASTKELVLKLVLARSFDHRPLLGGS